MERLTKNRQIYLYIAWMFYNNVLYCNTLNKEVKLDL